MPKKAVKKEKGGAKKVNVEIAPGNRSRLAAFISAFREDPERSRPALTLTDVLNEALDEYFSEKGGLAGGGPAQTKGNP